MARPGDTVVLFIDSVDQVIEQVKQAGKSVHMDESDAFWCPVPEPSMSGNHSVKMLTKELVNDGEHGHS
jgi:hypothetical protein